MDYYSIVFPPCNLALRNKTVKAGKLGIVQEVLLPFCRTASLLMRSTTGERSGELLAAMCTWNVKYAIIFHYGHAQQPPLPLMHAVHVHQNCFKMVAWCSTMLNRPRENTGYHANIDTKESLTCVTELLTQDNNWTLMVVWYCSISALSCPHCIY